MYGYIYITTNLINNKKYIGKHKSEIFDTKYYGSGILLKKSIKKYGIENFKVEILDVANSKDELNKLEIAYIDKFDCVQNKNFYNMSKGGDGGDVVAHLSPKEKEMFYKNRPNGMSGKNHSLDSIEKIKKSLKGKFKGIPKSETHKKKISDGNKGKHVGKKSGFKGKKHSEETKEKLRNARFGKTSPRKDAILSEETINKMSESKKGVYKREKHPLAKKCLLVQPNGEEFIFKCLNDLKDFVKDDMSSSLVKTLVRTGNPYKTNRTSKKYLEGTAIKYL